MTPFSPGRGGRGGVPPPPFLGPPCTWNGGLSAWPPTPPFGTPFLTLFWPFLGFFIDFWGFLSILGSFLINSDILSIFKVFLACFLDILSKPPYPPYFNPRTPIPNRFLSIFWICIRQGKGFLSIFWVFPDPFGPEIPHFWGFWTLFGGTPPDWFIDIWGFWTLFWVFGFFGGSRETSFFGVYSYPPFYRYFGELAEYRFF